MMDCKSMTTPMASDLMLLRVSSSESVDAMMYHQMIYSLTYLTNTRPYIFFAMNTLRHVHLMITKNVVRYLKGTVDYGLKYVVNHKINLHIYVDLDWEDKATDRNNNSRCCFSLGSSMISWFSKKQSSVALRTI